MSLETYLAYLLTAWVYILICSVAWAVLKQENDDIARAAAWAVLFWPVLLIFAPVLIFYAASKGRF